MSESAAITEKRFPIQGGLTVTWSAAEHAYATYKKHFGAEQSLERLAERGGFGLMEFAMLFKARCPGRDRKLDEHSFALALSWAGIRSTR